MPTKPSVLDQPIDLSLLDEEEVSGYAGQSDAVPQEVARMQPILDVVGYSVSEQRARDDVRRERGRLAQRWKQADEPPAPESLVSLQDFVRKHMPKMQQEEFIPPAQWEFIQDQYKNYVARTQYRNEMAMARYKATPSPLRETQRDALEQLLSESGGDPTKALDRFERLGVVRSRGTSKEAWDAELRKAALAAAGGDPVEANQLMKRGKPDPGGDTQKWDPADKAAYDEMMGKGMSATAAREALNTKPGDDRGIITSGSLSETLGGSTVMGERLPGLLERARPGGANRLLAYAELKQWSNANLGLLSKKEAARVKQELARVKITTEEAAELDRAGAFTTPEMLKFLEVEPTKWFGDEDRTRQAAIKAYFKRVQ
jgi:hypothetical protein